MNPKQRAAEAAAELVTSGMIVGLGTGSTADFFHVAIANRIKSGQLKNILGVPTSRRCEERAKELGIPLTSLAAHPHPDITVDGADQIAPNLDAIKGLGGALLREKIVAENSKRFVLIADASKLVPQLGDRTALPVEVATFSYEIQEHYLRSLGCEPTLRLNADGSPYVTDNGNYIYDCVFKRIDDPAALHQKIRSHAGIVETGLFPNVAAIALIAGDPEVKELRNSRKQS